MVGAPEGQLQAADAVGAADAVVVVVAPEGQPQAADAVGAADAVVVVAPPDDQHRRPSQHHQDRALQLRTVSTPKYTPSTAMISSNTGPLISCPVTTE